MPLTLTFGFSLLQSDHVFHLDAEMYSCSSAIGPFSSRTCEMMPIANEVSVCSLLLLQARRNSRIRRSPAGIEGMARTVDVDDQWCVIRGQRFFLPRLAIDLRPDNSVVQWLRHE